MRTTICLFCSIWPWNKTGACQGIATHHMTSHDMASGVMEDTDCIHGFAGCLKLHTSTAAWLPLLVCLDINVHDLT